MNITRFSRLFNEVKKRSADSLKLIFSQKCPVGVQFSEYSLELMDSADRQLTTTMYLLVEQDFEFPLALPMRLASSPQAIRRR